MSRILIIEDEESIAELEKDYLELSGFEVEIENNGETGLKRGMEEDFDLLILDLMLPGIDGFEICKKIREVKNTPIIMVSAKKDDIDKIRGLGLGADDYITKPFSFPVLVAKAQALMRRARGLRLGASELGYANILMDTASGTVTVDGNPVNLRPKEAKILELLLREQGRTVSRDLLIERVWGTDFDGDERMIDRHIASLRKALGTASQHIRAVYGKGYRLGGST